MMHHNRIDGMTNQIPPHPVEIWIPTHKDPLEIEKLPQIIVPEIPALRPQSSAILAMVRIYPNAPKFVALSLMTTLPVVAPILPAPSRFAMTGMTTKMMNGINLVGS
jgi:hypothetical protein